MNIQLDEKNIVFFKSLASETRIQIIKMLSGGGKNINAIASELGISSAIVTKHISMLEESGIVLSESLTGIHGRQKMCYLKENIFTVSLSDINSNERFAQLFSVGDYSSSEILSLPCGIESTKGIVGLKNDVRYFNIPDRTDFNDLWFAEGRLTYQLTNEEITDVKQIDFEINCYISCEEYADFAGNITLQINSDNAWKIPIDISKKAKLYKISISDTGFYCNGSYIGESQPLSRITANSVISIGTISKEDIKTVLHINNKNNYAIKISVY